MLRSSARQLISVHRGWSSSVGKSLGGAASSSSHYESSRNANNANAFTPTRRWMSDAGGGGGWSWSKNIPGFGSKPIAQEPDTAGDGSISAEKSFTDGQDTITDTLTTPSVDESMSKIYGSDPIATPATESAIATADSSLETAAELIPHFDPTWWPSDQMLLLLNWVNENAGLPCYAYGIAATTLAFRVALLPLFITGQRSSSRMAHMQPEMKKMKDDLDKMGRTVDQASQIRHVAQTKALFKKYDCNPMMGIVAPLFSAPIFMSMFFGLKNAPEYFPDLLSNGGVLWFTDLTVADPYCIMPCLSALTFLAMTEVGKEQMMATDAKRGKIMVNAFRALAVVMVPITMNFNAGVFVYWTTNNTWSFCQTVLLKQPVVKKMFGIWDPPKPVPGQESKGIFAEIQKLVENKPEKAPSALAEDRVKAHNEIVAQQKLVRKKLMEKEGFEPKRRKN